MSRRKPITRKSNDNMNGYQSENLMRPSTSSTVDSTTVNQLDLILKQLNDAKSGKEKTKYFDNLKKYFKNVLNEDFACMLFESMELNKTAICEICDKISNSAYENIQHLVIIHNVHLNNLNDSLAKRQKLQNLYNELKVVSENTPAKNMELRDKIKNIEPELLKKLDDKLTKPYFDSDKRIYYCRFCKKYQNKIQSNLAMHFFDKHNMFWRIDDSDLPVTEQTETYDVIAPRKSVPRTNMNSNINRTTRTQLMFKDREQRQVEKRTHNDLETVDSSYNTKIRKLHPSIPVEVIAYNQLKEKINRFVNQYIVFKAIVTSIYPAERGKYQELHLKDASNTYFKCFVDSSFSERIDRKIKEGKEYYFKYVAVTDYTDSYSIKLINDSEIELVKEVPLRDIQKLPISFKVDVVGTITNIGYLKRYGVMSDGRENNLREVDIRDEFNNQVTLVFWNDKAEFFDFEEGDTVNVINGSIYEYSERKHIAVTRNSVIRKRL